MADNWDMTEVSQWKLHSSENCSRWPAVSADMEVGWLVSKQRSYTAFSISHGQDALQQAVLGKQQHLSISRKSMPA